MGEGLVELEPARSSLTVAWRFLPECHPEDTVQVVTPATTPTYAWLCKLWEHRQHVTKLGRSTWKIPFSPPCSGRLMTWGRLSDDSPAEPALRSQVGGCDGKRPELLPWLTFRDEYLCASLAAWIGAIRLFPDLPDLTQKQASDWRPQKRDISSKKYLVPVIRKCSRQGSGIILPRWPLKKREIVVDLQSDLITYT